MPTQGERIKHARTQAGLSQAKLAAEISKISGMKVGKSLISQWENGLVNRPNSANMFGIERVTGFRAAWIVSGKGPEKLAEVDASGMPGMNLSALERAIVAVLPDMHDAPAKARVIASVYDALLMDPTTNPETLVRMAASLARR